MVDFVLWVGFVGWRACVGWVLGAGNLTVKSFFWIGGGRFFLLSLVDGGRMVIWGGG